MLVGIIGVLFVVFLIPLVIGAIAENVQIANERYSNVYHINSAVKADLIKGEKIMAKKQLKELGYEIKTRRTGSSVNVDLVKIPLSLEEEEKIENRINNWQVVRDNWDEIVADFKKGGCCINDLAKKYNFTCDDAIVQRFLNIK